jgi:hypothetical protein
MPWNQKNARFYCEVYSARRTKEVILSDAYKGLVIIAAGEQGMLRVTLRADGIEEKTRTGPRGGIHVESRRHLDKFMVEFCPWRSCEAEGDPVVIASGPLDFDRVKHGEAMVRFDDQAIEVYRTMRAIEIIKETS